MAAPTYNVVTVVGQAIYGNNNGEPVTVTLTPNSPVYFDTANNVVLAPQPMSTTSAADGTWSIANIIDPTPGGTGLSWKLQIQDKSTNMILYNQTVQIAYNGGTSQGFLALSPATANPATIGTLPLPGGAAIANQVPASNGNGSASTWSYQNSAWLNVKNYGARGNGTTDDTAAIQAALTAAASQVSVVYFPSGTYKVTAALTYTSRNALRICGDIMNGWSGGTSISFAPGATPYTVLSVTNAFALDIENISVIAQSNPVSPAGYTGILTSGVSTVRMSRVNVYGASSTGDTGGVDVGIEIASAESGSVIQHSTVSATTKAVWMNGGQILDILHCQFGCATGVSSGVIWADNSATTLNVEFTGIQKGDRGIYFAGYGLLQLNAVGINIMHTAGIELVSGNGGLWANQLWISYAGGNAGNLSHGLLVDAAYDGGCYFNECTFQDNSGHGAWIEGGSGFIFENCVFGGNGAHTANTYDDIHIASGVSVVTVSNSHFDTDPFEGLSSPAARSALYIESGVTKVKVAGNIFAASGYGTAAVVNNAASATVTLNDNLGYNPVGKIGSPPGVPSSTNSVTNTTGVDCTVYVTCGAGVTVSVTALGALANATGVTVAANGTSSGIRVPAGQSIYLTYAGGTPSWNWFGE